MKETLNIFSTEIQESHISNIYTKNYHSLHTDYLELQRDWLHRAYSQFQDLDKYFILISLVNKTMNAYSDYMLNYTWDEYYKHYTDWDDAHRFNVRLELVSEKNLQSLGYTEFRPVDELFYPDNTFSNKTFPQSKTYKKKGNEIIISFEVPYDWSIDTDWEDKALILLGLNEEWVIDS